MTFLRFIALLLTVVCVNANSLPTIAELSGDYPTPSSFIRPLGSSGILWTYTTSQPASGWMNVNYSTTGWSSGYGGFYSGATNPNEQNNTPFNTNLWLRATVNLSSSDVQQFMLWGRWDDRIDIYINGVLAASKVDWVGSYEYIGLNSVGRNALQIGNNVIAVRLVNAGGSGYFNLAIARNSGLANPPVTGFTKTKKLNWVTDHVKRIIAQEAIPATTVAIAKMRSGQMEVVYSAGFGHMDKQLTTPVKQDAVLRLASTDKTPTWVALRNMMINTGNCNNLGLATQPNASTIVNPATGAFLTCTDQVYDIMIAIGALPGGSAPSGVAQITLRHMLEYRDFFRPRPNQEVASEMNAYYAHLGINASQTSPLQLMRWYFTNPTQQTPGSVCLNPQGQVEGCYNSDGAAVARYLINHFGGSIEGYLQNTLMQNSLVKDIFVAHERVAGRQLYANGSLREPWYRTQRAPFPFWVGLEDALALSASAETLAATFPRFGYGLTWGRGGMPGTTTLVDPLTLSDSSLAGVAWLSSGPSYRIAISSGERHTDAAFVSLRNLLNALPLNDWTPEQGRIRQSQTGFCIHPSGGASNPANGTSAVIWNDCSNQDRLNFRYTPSFGIQQVSSNKCLHPEGGVIDPAIGTKVVFWSGCDEKRLDFKIMLDGKLMHIPSGKCVVPDGAASGSELRIQSCSGSIGNKLFEFVTQ